MAHELQQIPEALTALPGPAIVLPPIRTSAQELPYSAISWQNFERLCVRLVSVDAELKGCRLYGEQGNEQDGIDLFSFRAGSRKFTVCQCKNVATFGPADIKAAVRLFIDGEWLSESDRLILALQDRVNTKARCDAVAAQIKLLSGLGVEFEVWDADGLDLKLKTHPQIVEEFFGSAWAGEFCGVGERNTVAAVPTAATPEERDMIAEIIEGMAQ